MGRDTDEGEEDMTVTESSGNVFADLGFPDAEERLAKADLVIAIGRCISERRLTQRQAALILGIGQGAVSNLLRGYFDGFTIDRLARMLNALDQDVYIHIGPKRGEHARTVVMRDEAHPDVAGA